MEKKIKELNELKEFCVSVDDIAEVNFLNYSYNLLMKLHNAIDKCIDLKIVELKMKKEISEKGEKICY